jgi:BlaI family transcriptional regulator, penicillinase repressor
MLQSRFKKNIEQFPTFELAVMHVLWDRGASTVRQVMQDLPGNPAYTTVQTILNIMTSKGRTKRALAGRTYVYRANVKREACKSQSLQAYLRGHSANPVLDLLKALLNMNRLHSELHEWIIKSLMESITANENGPRVQWNRIQK